MLRIVIAALMVIVPALPTDAAPRAGLPYAQGKSFDTLDAYLKHLENLGPIGVPFYREVKPGRYERQLSYRIPGKPVPHQSRDELARKYGFADQR